MGKKEMEIIAGFIADVLKNPEDEMLSWRIRTGVQELCSAFPLYPL